MPSCFRRRRRMIMMAMAMRVTMTATMMTQPQMGKPSSMTGVGDGLRGNVLPLTGATEVAGDVEDERDNDEVVEGAVLLVVSLVLAAVVAVVVVAVVVTAVVVPC